VIEAVSAAEEEEDVSPYTWNAVMAPSRTAQIETVISLVFLIAAPFFSLSFSLQEFSPEFSSESFFRNILQKHSSVTVFRTILQDSFENIVSSPGKFCVFHGCSAFWKQVFVSS
jgi:hypothetical protein